MTAETPHVLVVGSAGSGKTTLLDRLRAKYGCTELSFDAKLSAQYVKEGMKLSSGCLIEDGIGDGSFELFVERDHLDLVVELEVPDDILLQRLVNRSDKNRNKNKTEESSLVSPFREVYSKSMHKYDDGSSIFLRVNGHGAPDDIFTLVDAFAEASVAHRGCRYDDAFQKYAEAGAISANLSFQEGVAAALCGQGNALIATNKLKRALMVMNDAAALDPDSKVINACLKKSKTLIREKLEERKRQNYLEKLKMKESEYKVARLRHEHEKKRWLLPLHEAIKVKNKQKEQIKQAQVAAKRVSAQLQQSNIISRINQEALLLSSLRSASDTHVVLANLLLSNQKFIEESASLTQLEEMRLKEKYKAYSRDMTRREIEQVIASRIAPTFAARVCEIGISKIMFGREAKIQQAKKEKAERDLFLAAEQSKKEKIMRITVFQKERKKKIEKVIKNAKSPQEACQAGVPLNVLKRLIHEETQRVMQKYKKRRSERARRGEDVGGRESKESSYRNRNERFSTPTITHNDVFDQLCVNTNAMIVESLHPYKPSCCHIVELTPNSSNDAKEIGVERSGLIIAFHEHCDIKSGAAEIKFFTDKSCTVPVGENVYDTNNLPSTSNPLFVSARSIVMMFKSRQFDDSYNKFYLASWGWKMCVVRAESPEVFKSELMKNALHSAAMKAALQGPPGTINCFSASCFSGNLFALQYLIHLGSSYAIFDVNKQDALTGNTLLHDAASVGNYDIIKFLLLKGAMREARNFQSETPLHFAARLNHMRCVKLLLFTEEIAKLSKKLGRVKMMRCSNDSRKKIIGHFKGLNDKRRAIQLMANHRGRSAFEIANMGGKFSSSDKRKVQRPFSAVVRQRNTSMLKILGSDGAAPLLLGRPRTAAAATMRGGATPGSKPGRTTGNRVEPKIRPKTASPKMRRPKTARGSRMGAAAASMRKGHNSLLSELSVRPRTAEARF